jgi:hypothetical protein
LTNFTDSAQVGAWAWSPDGQRLAVLRSVQTNDIIAIQRAAVANSVAGKARV